jgi:ATP synthase protein I
MVKTGDNNRDQKDNARAPVNRSREERKKRFWYDFARYNLTGWSVVVPTFAGLAAGAWIDNRWPGAFSWKLTLMLVGLGLGCLNAWYWIKKKDKGQ